MVDILINNILSQRGLIDHEQKWEDRKMVKTARDEITIGTEHWRSDEWKEKGPSCWGETETRPCVAPL